MKMNIVSEFEAKMAEIEFQNVYGDTVLVPTQRYHKLVNKLGVPQSVVKSYIEKYVTFSAKQFNKFYGDMVSS